MSRENYIGKIILGGVGFMPKAEDIKAIQEEKMDLICKLGAITGNTDITSLVPFHAEDNSQIALILSLPETSRGFGLKEDEYKYEIFTLNGKTYCLALVIV